MLSSLIFYVFVDLKDGFDYKTPRDSGWRNDGLEEGRFFCYELAGDGSE